MPNIYREISLQPQGVRAQGIALGQDQYRWYWPGTLWLPEKGPGSRNWNTAPRTEIYSRRAVSPSHRYESILILIFCTLQENVAKKTREGAGAADI